MWKLEYNIPKGYRIKKDIFDGVTTNAIDLWFVDDNENFKSKVPVTREASRGLNKSSHGLKHINSVKAFERYLRKHCTTSKLRSVEFTLCSRYFYENDDGTVLGDYSVKAKWIEN